MYITLCITCFKKLAYYETMNIDKLHKHWRNNQMQYWLMKSEPNVWSIDQQKKSGAKGTSWDGVRNYQAANNLKKIKKKLFRSFYLLKF